MEQALANILDETKKLYQLRSVYHDKIQKELSIRDIAISIAHQKDVSLIAQTNQEKLKIFLEAASKDDSTSLDNVSIACSVINMATHPIVRTGKRYLEAVDLLNRVKSIATTYEKLKSGLNKENALVEEELKLTSDLSTSLMDGRLIDMDIYIPFFKKSLYPEDSSSCLVAVTAIVRKNAELLENGEVQEDLPYHLFPEQNQKIEQYETMINQDSANYNEMMKNSTTNLFIQNIKALLDSSQLTLEEARILLQIYPGLYEYLIWSSLKSLLSIAKGSDTTYHLLETMDEIEKLSDIYQKLALEEVKIKTNDETVEKEKENFRKENILLYNTWVDKRVPTFPYQNINRETYSLMEQLRWESNNENIIEYEGDVCVIKGETTFILFRKFPKNHIFLITTGDLNQMSQIVTDELIALLARSYTEMNNWIISDSKEYESMLDISRTIENYLSNNVGGNS